MTIRQRLISVSYTLTIFVSALLLFVIQPMSSDMILPHLGGSSAVWTTCMLFFQILLLAGYIYAHGIAQYFSPTMQVCLHVAVILGAVLFLPVHLPESVLRIDQAPALYLVAALLLGIGMPTFVVSSSAPLLQHWFGALRHPHSDDPYYLYAASNAGSLLALLSYPFLVDRFLMLDTQSAGWTYGFLLLCIMIGVCGLLVLLSGQEVGDGQTTEASDASVTVSRRLYWVLVTFIPSSLMLGVTHYMTMDIASVPLLWVVPLALYLLSYILVFARLKHPLWLYRIILPPSALLVFALTLGKVISMVPVLVIHTVLFFLVALYFHGLLARDRPPVQHLTGYYICMALGGSLGGVFNALIAPLIFHRLLEYVLVMALGLVCAFHWFDDRRSGWFTQLVGYALTAGSFGYFSWKVPLHLPVSTDVLWSVTGALGGVTLLGLVIMLYRYSMWKLPVHAGLGLLLFLGFLFQEDRTHLIVRARSFYGQYEVVETEDHVRRFFHGTTDHGKQRRVNGEFVNKPTGYYHPEGPFGDIFRKYETERAGIAGLGTGGLAPYRKEGETFYFFEIDPVVHRIARQQFGYLEECGSGCSVQIGDGRQLIEEYSEKFFDVLVMDAYTSDAIPTHLLTKEAIQLYLSRIRDDGVVVLHISNRHFNLERVVGAIAQELNVPARVKRFHPMKERMEQMSFLHVENPIQAFSGDTVLPSSEMEGADAVQLAVIAKTESALKPLIRETGWKRPSGNFLLWTDRHTNIVPLLFEERSDEDSDS